MIQDTVFIQTMLQNSPTGLALNLQQVLVAIWTVGSVVMIPMVKMLIETLKSLDQTTKELKSVVLGIEGGGESLVDQVKRLEQDAEDDRDVVRFVVAKLREAKSFEELKLLLDMRK